MIDMHIHAVNPHLPGVKTLPVFLDAPPSEVGAIVREQMTDAGVEIALGMGQFGGEGDDPLGIASTLAIAGHVPGLFAIGVANPTRTDDDHLARVEAQLKRGLVKALKGYLGYVYHGPDSPGYFPYYELAARYNIPVIFHTGDNYSTVAKVKYAHPLLVDEVAVEYRAVRFVMAHFGNPWMIDAAEVLYKNDNVWADLSGLVVGDDAWFFEATRKGLIARVIARFHDSFAFTERPDRFLYGSDWPLATMSTYRDFVLQMVPPEHHEAVFETNARELFSLG
jgi:predicted TIM-barrel fold metal-dependent hydrolase